MSLRTHLGARLRQLYWWRALRRIQAEGASRAFRRWRQWSQVLATAPVYADAPGRSPVEVHLLCHRGDHLCAIWALKTLYLTSGVRWPAVIHVQGMCTAAMKRRFRRHVPDARVIAQDEADARVLQALGDRCPRLIAARRQSPFMMKLIDLVLLASAERIVILDSDVLFFRDPRELRAHVEQAPAETWLFQRDPASTYNVSSEEAASAGAECEQGLLDPSARATHVGVLEPTLAEIEIDERPRNHCDATVDTFGDANPQR